MATPIGKKIETELRKQRIPITTFAGRINCTRNNVYSIFKRKSVNTELLNKIAIVLNVDTTFFYSDPKAYKTDHPPKATEEAQVPYEAGEQLKLQKKLIAFMEEDKKASDLEIKKLKETIKRLQEKIRKLSKAKK